MHGTAHQHILKQLPHKLKTELGLETTRDAGSSGQITKTTQSTSNCCAQPSNPSQAPFLLIREKEGSKNRSQVAGRPNTHTHTKKLSSSSLKHGSSTNRITSTSVAKLIISCIFLLVQWQSFGTFAQIYCRFYCLDVATLFSRPIVLFPSRIKRYCETVCSRLSSHRWRCNHPKRRHIHLKPSNRHFGKWKQSSCLFSCSQPPLVNSTAVDSLIDLISNFHNKLTSLHFVETVASDEPCPIAMYTSQGRADGLRESIEYRVHLLPWMNVLLLHKNTPNLYVLDLHSPPPPMELPSFGTPHHWQRRLFSALVATSSVGGLVVGNPIRKAACKGFSIFSLCSDSSVSKKNVRNLLHLQATFEQSVHRVQEASDKKLIPSGHRICWYPKERWNLTRRYRCPFKGCRRSHSSTRFPVDQYG